MTEPSITACMLVRDRADLLEQSARTVLAQTEPDLELVILDDASVDETWQVAQRIAAADERVVLLRNVSSSGIPAARNQVLEAARGRYLAICDSDDLSRPERFASQRAMLDADPALVGVGGGFHAFTNDPTNGADPGWHWGLPDGRLPFSFPTAMFRTDALREVGGFDPSFRMAEDLELCYRLAQRGGTFAALDEVVLDYRIHAGSITQGRALAREWHNLRAQLSGLRQLRGRFSPRGYAVLVQSMLRLGLAAIGLRR